jgi:hypothetical protein
MGWREEISQEVKGGANGQKQEEKTRSGGRS